MILPLLGVAKPAFVTLRNVAGRTVYRAPVASLGTLPSDACNHAVASVSTLAIGPAVVGGHSVSRSSSGTFFLVPKGSGTIP